MDYRIISIGTLAAHPLWNEKGDMRTGHATTTLISHENQHVIVDPSLPEPAMMARLGERTNVRATDVTHVFLTSFEALRRRSITAFPNAKWMLHEPERDAATAVFKDKLDRAQAGGDEELEGIVLHDKRVLESCVAAPDSLMPGLDLFPLPGVTAGTCGLLIALPRLTVLICGDAVPTVEHIEQGKVLPHGANLELAQESFAEAIEIADVLIPGRDNVTLNPGRMRV